MRKLTGNSEQFSDEALLIRYRDEGDQDSLGILYDRYLHLVYGLCLKYLKDRESSQDAAMDIYEILVSKLRHHEVAHFKSWLYIVSKNHCLMKLRQSSPETNNEIFLMESAIAEHPNDAGPMEENLEALEKCMETLKKEQEQCVRLFYLERKSYEEIAQKEKYPLKSVKSHIQNGKRNLKICLESKNVQS